MKEIHFHNVSISIVARSPEEAYTTLCQLFQPGVRSNEIEFETDTFSIDDSELNRPTSDIWEQF